MAATGGCISIVPPSPSKFSYSFSKSRLPPLRRRIVSELKEIRVCTNRTCRRQGSTHTLYTLSALAPPDVAVNPCGCLGRCGSGPNIVALPDTVLIGHCGTAARACQVIADLSGSVGDAKTSLEALALRKRAETEIEKSDFSQAEILLSQAIDLKPFGGIHFIYKVRSLARLGMGDYSGALQDVSEALKLAPNFTEAYICQGDIFLAMDQYDAAEKSYATCLDIDPSIRRSKSFKSRIVKLQEKLTSTNVP